MDEITAISYADGTDEGERMKMLEKVKGNGVCGPAERPSVQVIDSQQGCGTSAVAVQMWCWELADVLYCLLLFS